MLIGLALVGCNDSAVQINVNGESYTFRKSMVFNSERTGKVTSDNYSPLILIFRGADIKKVVPEYPIDDNAELTAQVYFNYSFDVQFISKPYLLMHEFKEGVYEYDQKLGLYKVFNKYYKDSHEKFSLLTKKPSNSNPVPSDIFDFHEGECLYLLTTEDYRCNIYAKVGSHAVLTNTGNIESLYHREGLKIYIKKVLLEAKTGISIE